MGLVNRWGATITEHIIGRKPPTKDYKIRVSIGAAGATDGSAGSTEAARVGREADLDGAAIELAVGTVVASPNVPQTS